MYSRFLFVTAAALGLLHAQTLERKATFKYGGEPNRGKCTVEVVVDGAADVEIRGDTAVLRNLGGAPPQWRRFECTGALPANPANFRFSGVDGRGRQTLMRPPSNGGAAVVRIEDKDNGSEGYTFDIEWGGGGGGGGYPQGDRGRDDRGYPPDQQPGGPPVSDRDRGYPPDQQRGGPPVSDRDRGYPPDQQRGGPPVYDRGRDGDRDRDGRDHDAFYRGRDERFRAPDFRQRFFQHIREDLDHVQSMTFPFSNDQYRIARTKQQLDELQAKLARGFYDERELDDVVRALQRVVADNRLSRGDRDILGDDLERLRDFRARHDYYGAR